MDGDGDGIGRWLTYQQLAEARGITRKTAIRMVQRHRWRRQPGNDGSALIWVPHEDLTPRPPSRQTGRQQEDVPSRQDGDGDGDGATPVTAFHAKALAALEAALSALREVHEGAVADLRQRAERAEQGLAAERSRADVLRSDLDHARATAQEAEQAATIAVSALEAARRADDARKARGRWARLRAAWRGR